MSYFNGKDYSNEKLKIAFTQYEKGEIDIGQLKSESLRIAHARQSKSEQELLLQIAQRIISELKDYEGKFINRCKSWNGYSDELETLAKKYNDEFGNLAGRREFIDPVRESSFSKNRLDLSKIKKYVREVQDELSRYDDSKMEGEILNIERIQIALSEMVAKKREILNRMPDFVRIHVM